MRRIISILKWTAISILGLFAVLVIVVVAFVPSLEEQCANGNQGACNTVAKRAAEERLEAERAAAEAAAKEAAKLAEETEKRRKGFHCLSTWDGSHRDVVQTLKASLRDPDSFEHIETRITPVDEEGNHVLLMEYRARNGFGGMAIGNLMATVRSSNCSATIIANTNE